MAEGCGEVLNFGQISQDWMAVWTVKQAEEELDGFQFQGPGWYETDYEAHGSKQHDSLLVLPVGVSPIPVVECKSDED